MSRMTRSQALGRSIWELMDKMAGGDPRSRSHVAKGIAELQAAVQRGELVAINGTEEVQYVLPHGVVRHVEHHYFPVRIGSQTFLANASRDIAERKQAKESLIRASRLEATATLAGGIAHDFNNLMVGVLGYADLLKMELEGQVDAARWPDTEMMLNTVSGSARKANVLAQQMLAFARGGKYQSQAVNLNDAVQKVILCSGYEMDETTQALLDAGARAFIPKPFQTSTLEKEMRRVLAD